MERPPIEKMMVACHLLEPPAGEVVTELCEYILYLEQANEKLAELEHSEWPPNEN